ncbi:MAG TPA: hypothetical protein VI733_03475 [Candidatus Limnocylindria bacterium]|nr:hypothetical protein [Candidatus Limnocylindria bacterium]
MSCRRVSRELLERFRFGEELDTRSEPHLRHLQSCGACREEVGLDRALVIQLRRALEARVGDATPPARTWEAVRSRALSSDAPGVSRGGSAWRWMRLVPAATVMTVMVFAVAVAPDAERPTAIQERNLTSYQVLPADEPEWEMPWWLSARTGPPPARLVSGPTVMTAPDEVPRVRLGPFAPSLQ